MLRLNSAPPVIVVDGVRWPDLDLCKALAAAKTGSTVLISGTRDAPLEMSSQPSTSATSARCKVAPKATDVHVVTEGSPLVKGELTLVNADGWVLDGLAMTASASTDHGPLVVMVGGNGWRWTNCELWGSGGYAELNVGSWAGAIPQNFVIDHCYIHDNPGSSTAANNQNHNAYIFTTDGIPAHGLIAHNVFVGAPRGWNVKIGGTGLQTGEGSDDITFVNNTLVNNRPDGANLLVSTDSDDLVASHNIFVSQGNGTAKVSNVELGSYTGSNNELDDNLFWGYDPALWPQPRPILYANSGVFQSIDLNQSTSLIGQSGNRRMDVRYPAIGTWNPDRHLFPPVTIGGVTYGAVQ